ncbi:helix-turn-helix domain-containing protein [Chryseobacterium taiwanense]|uniref:HTH araC/xylS-type domain-containing protein n=1 Tax=Chryseobacterium taiwanense TaxID=363331 RepID=A0A0B4D7P1_9FLAO|nr:AraC family transcriptional regulator [Chryseobacterium taiwanense]KIC62726.1 hypothetical protein RM51_11085 [Chryseobacterium taiwanense]
MDDRIDHIFDEEGKSFLESVLSAEIIKEDVTKQDLYQLRGHLPYKTLSYCSNTYTIILVIDGQGLYKRDNTAVEIEPFSILLNKPNSQCQITWYRIGQAYCYKFSEQFLLRYAGVSLYKMFPFLLFECTAPSILNREIYNKLVNICVKIDDEFRLKSMYRKYMLANLLVRLLLNMKQTFWPFYQYTNIENRGRDILKNFTKHLEEQYEQIEKGKQCKQLRVKDYAGKQSLHENYFSQHIKLKSGKTAKQWIDEKACVVAIHMIQSSTRSVKEIAYLLGFSYTSQLTAFIKKMSGNNPTFYRESR